MITIVRFMELQSVDYLHWLFSELTLDDDDVF